MFKLLGRITKDFLWDESKFQRYGAAGLFGLGTLLINGGSIPGTDIILADLSAYSGWGSLLQWGGIYFGAGVKAPGGVVTNEAVANVKATVSGE